MKGTEVVGELIRCAEQVALLAARRLVSELRESTERMSSLIGAVKTYAYMDRGGVVEADIHEGLETTMTVLAHKLKHTGSRSGRSTIGLCRR